MILIGGTELSSGELPFGDLMEYVVENNPMVLNIKLKTIAKSSVCLGVYLHTDLSSVEIPEDVREKVHYFSSDDELISKLEVGGTPSQEGVETSDPSSLDNVESVDDNVDGKVFSAPVLTDVADPVEPGTYDVLSPEALEEADLDLADSILTIPEVKQDINSLSWQLEMKDRVIQQKDGIISDLRKQIDDLYRVQEIQLLEMRSEYEKRIELANSTIARLEDELKRVSVPEEYKDFLRYAPYTKSLKAALREGFSEEEREQLGKLRSKFYIFASGAGDSLHLMLRHIKSLVDEGKRILLVDFSNDYFLGSRLNLKSADSSLQLNLVEFEVKSLVRSINGVDIIPTTFYNDIGLLTFDWVSIIKKLDLYASGRPVFLLFNNINSFSVRFTVSKLATLGQLFIFASCNPSVLTTLSGDAAFIPNNRLVIVALEYFNNEKIDTLLHYLSKKYPVIAFGKEISWKKLEINI